MIVINNPSEIKNFINKPLTPSEWYHVTQEKINKFADATSDHQWIHVDEERAKKEMPDGKTIAHGYYMVSLLPKLAAQNAEIKNTSRTLNYGSDKVRFINPVPSGSKVRVRSTLKEVVEKNPGQWLLKSEAIMEIEGIDKPAYVAETLTLFIT